MYSARAATNSYIPLFLLPLEMQRLSSSTRIIASIATHDGKMSMPEKMMEHWKKIQLSALAPQRHANYCPPWAAFLVCWLKNSLHQDNAIRCAALLAADKHEQHYLASYCTNMEAEWAKACKHLSRAIE
eukprot:TRINITY_DN12462_c0_g3_i1.p2 TRINITY_DN12462_c0_g3~~TRINITY_DN12462_c0_g3_i1.p2  ORF type:complete len:129 (+),score=12.55 TRINITY_DN12462_c0_g3_i1:2416-2802(+)